MRTSQHSGWTLAGTLGVVAAVAAAGGCAGQFNLLRKESLPRVWERGLIGLMRPDETAAHAGSERGVHTASVHNRAGLTRLRDGHYHEAVRHFELAIRLAPQWAEPRENLGRLYERIGRADRAIVLYESALAREPRRWSTIQRLAGVYVSTGRRDGIAQALLMKLAADPRGGRWSGWAQTQLARMGRS